MESGIAHIYFSENKPIRVYITIRSQRKYGHMWYGEFEGIPTVRLVDNLFEYTYVFKTTVLTSAIYVRAEIDGKEQVISFKITPGADKTYQLESDLHGLYIYYINFMLCCGSQSVSHAMIKIMLEYLRSKLVAYQEFLSIKEKDKDEYRLIIGCMTICNVFLYKYGKCNIINTRRAIYSKYLQCSDLLTC